MEFQSFVQHVIAPCVTSLLLMGCAAPALLMPIPATPTRPAPIGTVVPIAQTTQPLEVVWKITGNPNPLSKPTGVAVDANENVFVVDAGNSRVQKFDRNGKFVTMWGGPGNGAGQFNINDGGIIVLDAEGNFYVADNGNYRIQKFDRNGKFLTQFGTQGNQIGQFSWIADIKVDKQNNVYVLDGNNNYVQAFNSNGEFLLRWGSKGFENGKLSMPSTLAIDNSGNVLVAGGTVPPPPFQRFDRNGKFIIGYHPSLVGDYAIDPGEIVLDSQGNIYVADYNNKRIVKLDSNTNFIAAWGGFGTEPGQFYKMSGIDVDLDGNIYVADYGNNSVQKFRQSSFHP